MASEAWSTPTARLTTVSAMLLAQAVVGLGIVVLGPATVAVIGVLLTVPIVVIGWPLSGVSLLLISTALNRYRYDIAGWGLKLEYVAVAYVFTVWVAKIMAARIRLRISVKELILTVWLSTNLLSSLLNAPARNQSLKYFVLLFLLALMYFMLVHLLSDEDVLQRAVILFLIVGTVASLFGIVARWLYVFGLDLGVQIDPFTNDPIPYGTFWEGNIFGSYTMSLALFFLTFLAVSDLRRRYLGALLGGFVVTSLAMLLSLSRGAFTGFASGILLIFLIMRKSPLRLWVLASATIGFLGLVLSGVTGMHESQSPIVARLLSLGNLMDTVSWQVRVYYYQQAINSWRTNPLLGWGTGSFGQLYRYVSVDLPAWIGNLEIHLLHDTGLLGLGAFVLFLAMVISDAMRAVARAATGFHRNLLIAFLVSFVGLLTAYQATEATWLGFTWVHIAFLVATTRVVLAKNSSGVATQATVNLDGSSRRQIPISLFPSPDARSGDMKR